MSDPAIVDGPTPRDLHREAMALADRAALARRAGQEADAVVLFRDALEREAAAARFFESDTETEPTRSVLYRSAASLALDVGDYRVAERLIATALIGEPPDSIANELRDLMEMVYFQRHLDLRGVRLDIDEFQFSIEGEGIGFGIAPAGQFVGRVRDVETLIYRTAERKLNLPFRESGRRKKALDDSLQLFVSVPRAASFAVTFRIGASEQPEFPEFKLPSLPSDVVREVLDCFDLVNRGELNTLEARIGSEPYFRNFVGLAQKIAPDGEIVRAVGFTSSDGAQERRVALTVPKTKIARHKKPSAEVAELEALLLPEVAERQLLGMSSEGELIEIQGTLLEADAKDAVVGRIEVRRENGAIDRMRVPRGMMRDIVRPLFEEEVVVTAVRRVDGLFLESIRPADE